MPETNLAITQEPGGVLRRFSDAKINEAVSNILATIPAGKTAAFLAVADLHSARVAVAVRIGEHWSIAGVLEKPWKGEMKAEAMLRAVF